MKDLIIAGNWKSNKTTSETKEWLDKFTSFDFNFINKKIIIFPSFTLFFSVQFYLLTLKSIIEIGAQDISSFGEGAYTSMINGKQIKEFCSMVLIGHSEAREYLKEDQVSLDQKVKQAIASNLEIIYCVSSVDQEIPENIHIVAYEPLFAIGTGKPDTPEDANRICQELKNKNIHVKYTLYGGSVTPDNVNGFTSKNNIDGVLVGGASLDPQLFYQIIKNA